MFSVHASFMPKIVHLSSNTTTRIAAVVLVTTAMYTEACSKIRSAVSQSGYNVNRKSYHQQILTVHCKRISYINYRSMTTELSRAQPVIADLKN